MLNKQYQSNRDHFLWKTWQLIVFQIVLLKRESVLWSGKLDHIEIEILIYKYNI
jgi:hypothetical protein